MVVSSSPLEPAFPNASAWKLHVDGAFDVNGSETGLILVSLEGEKTSYALHFDFKVTNNKADYEALIVGLKLVEQLKVNVLEVFSDSIIMVNQVASKFQVKNERLAKYVQLTKCLLGQFTSVLVTQVARAENADADALARLASGIDRDEEISILIKKLLAPSIE